MRGLCLSTPKPDHKELVFDFTFADFSKEPPGIRPASSETAPIPTSLLRSQPAPETSIARQAASTTPPTQNATPAPDTGANVTDTSAVPVYSFSSVGNSVNAAGNTVPREEALPTTTPELLAELGKRAQSVTALLDQGNLGGLWFPAIGAKDVALALEADHANDVPEAQRGTFAGLAQPNVIDHLVRLGVTGIEIMPAHAFVDERHLPPLGLANAWGYNPIVLGAPDPRLAPDGWAEVRAATDALHGAVDFHLEARGGRGPYVSPRGAHSSAHMLR
jgi:hypothetical protein